MNSIRGPLRRSELLARFMDLAGELGLPADPADVTIGEDGRHPVDECEEALDRAIARARRRLPRYRLDPLDLTIRTDPRGGRTNLREVMAELRHATEARHRALAVADLRTEAAADRLSAERVAARWNVSRRTLFSWSGGVQKELGDCTSVPEFRPDDSSGEAIVSPARSPRAQNRKDSAA